MGGSGRGTGVSPLVNLLPLPQARVRCAAQHFHWSGNLGGIMKETGEFDAFNTIMAILRMRRAYPGRRPDEFYALDQDFRDFVDCKPCEWLMWLGGEGMRGWAGWTSQRVAVPEGEEEMHCGWGAGMRG